MRNPLVALKGKTIKSTSMREVDMYGDGVNVRQEYTITAEDGTVLVVNCDGGCDGQYARLESGKLEA
jgi:hypothetical protein